MSLTVAALRELVSLGLTAEQILRVAEAQDEGTPKAEPAMTARQERNRRYYEKRLNASENRLKASETSESGEATLPLPPSPQTPPPPPPTRECKTPIVPPTQQPAEATRRKPKRAIPDGFPTAEAIAEQQAKARSVGANLDVANQAERFRNWSISKDARYVDWAATWRNWCDRAINNAPKTAVASAQGRVQAPSEEDQQRRRLREYRRNGTWNTDDAGPRPEHPACRIPPALLAEFGFVPTAANDPKPDLFAEGEAA